MVALFMQPSTSYTENSTSTFFIVVRAINFALGVRSALEQIYLLQIVTKY
jgi:hypothetical protein